ncbi:MAG: flagellar basal body rod protein FlgB [Phycisphaerae bacterium]
MSAWWQRITGSRTAGAVELAARFAEERHRVLAENVANIDTPDYHTRSVDARAFQRALRDALDRDARGATLELRGPGVATDAAGKLRVEPSTAAAPNALFHDGTNARLESLMADVAENAQFHQLATTLLRTRFDGLMNAIRGRAG